MSTPVDDPPAGGLAGPPPSTWEFDVLAAAEGGGCGLREVAWEIFESTGVTARFGVPDERFQAFLGRPGAAVLGGEPVPLRAARRGASR